MFFRRRDRELDEEIRSHLAIEAKLRQERGEPPADAMHSAERDFGNVLLVKETTRDSWRLRSLERFGQDLRYGLRLLLRSKLFTATVLLVLAIGIGSVTAVFSLADAVMLRSLPVEKPEQLVWFSDPSFSWPIFREVRSRSKDLFSGLFAWTIDDADVDWNEGANRILVMFASGEYHSTLRVTPAAGRLLTPSDEDGTPVAVISYHAWERRFGRDPGVVGRTVRVHRVPFTIVGVEPQSFSGPAPGLASELTVSAPWLPRLTQTAADLWNPHMAWLHFMGRLRDGMPLPRANAALQVFWPQIMEDVTDRRMAADRRARYLARRTALMPGHNGFSRVRRRFSEPLLMLLGCVSLLLLATCASAANLLLARNAVRRRELAVRVALGASRVRLLRQLMTEGLLLSIGAAIVGIAFAYQASSVIVGLLQTSREPIWLDLTPDWRILGFSLALAVVTTLLFAAGPGLRAAGIDPGPALAQSSRAIRTSGGRWLVACQVALAVLLLCGAALFTRSLAHVLSADPGFDSRDVLLVSSDPVSAGYADSRLLSFYSTAAERLRSIPGVESAAFSWAPPVSDDMGTWTGRIEADGRPHETKVYFNVISPGYFSTMRQPLLSGRDFSSSEPSKVAIVNETFARTFFSGRDALGERISIGRGAENRDLSIVGIVRDSKYQRLYEPPQPIAFLPMSQSLSFLNSSDLMAEVRAPAAMTESIRQEMLRIDPNLTVRITTLRSRIAESLVAERSIAVLTAFLGAAALVLACAGLYGLAAFSLQQRTGEIGIRLALGASQRAVAGLILRDCLRMALPGVIAGLFAAAMLARYAKTLLHGIESLDPVAFGVAAVVTVAVALVAGVVPSRRASRLDPVTALRHE